MIRVKRLLALSLGATLIMTSVPTHADNLRAADQNTGSLAGRATREADPPYSNYSVRARLVSGGSGNTVPLGPDGRFAITGLIFPGDYLIELINNAQGDVECTEGPFKNPKSNINISCGKAPAAMWLTPLAAGLAATLGVATQSNGQ
ncbi:MAG: hypothetical protein ACRD2N_08125 [Vicinamibacterales bacterium]